MKLIRLFENQLSSSIIKEFNQQIKKNIISDFYGKAKSATKTSTVTNIKYGDIEYYMNPIFDICQLGWGTTFIFGRKNSANIPKQPPPHISSLWSQNTR